MKKMTIMQYALAGISILFLSTSAQSQSVSQLLKDNGKKQEIFNTIVNDSILLTEFTNTMMKNPQSCKIMMKNEGMMKMMMSDTTMKKNMKNMKSMNMHADSTVYTCSMHPEITSKKPGKCPKCGMDLIKKPASKKMDMGDMKMN
jgi:hypothetical protein